MMRVPSAHYSVLAGAERAAFLRKVYLLVTGGVFTSAAAAAFACFAGASTPVAIGHGLSVPPLVYFFLEHGVIGMLLFLGAAFGSSFVARKPGLNVFALFGFAAVVGLVLAPAIYFAELRASAGTTISPSPVLHAFALASIGFTGLSTYAVVSRRDFSMIGGFLTMGLFVVIGASILNIFFGGATLSLAIASVTVLLFGGFILYDSSRLLQAGESEAVPAALSLYLDFLNLFLALLRIFGSDRRND